MFLTITTTGTPERPATDLGFLLHKHPDRSQAFSTAHGPAHVFYPEATVERCTAALLLEVDPVALVRKARGADRNTPDTALAQYVNDRPYAASSLLAVALSRVFTSALKGHCPALPERAAAPLPLRIEVPALPANGGPELVRRMFEPLGWTVTATPVPLDGRFPEWGDSRYVRLVLEGRARTLSEALRHLYVLLPVLDSGKHYWIGQDEVDKLLRAGGGWLAAHPEHVTITHRFLSQRRELARSALERLALERLAQSDDTDVDELDNAVDPVDEGTEGAEGADTGERAVPLAVERRAAIVAALTASGAARVLDLGCGQGQLLGELLKDSRFTQVVGMDVSPRALAFAAKRLRLGRTGERRSSRITLFQGSLAYTDRRLEGYDAAVLCEVVEHVDPARLPTVEHTVFGAARPATVVVTTPNAEYNVRWETLPAGRLRHRDHRFEWRRDEFRAWADRVAARYGYTVAFRPVGPDDPEVGPPTQLALFHRAATVTGAPPDGGRPGGTPPVDAPPTGAPADRTPKEDTAA
ncbi:3' terminal RNA ribose 2'-O-methyltransferase Hen1 [Streptomyces sp. JNUCC 64]